MPGHQEYANPIRSIAELLRGPYEINFNRHFYRYTPTRPLEDIDADLKMAEEDIMRLLREVTE